MLLDRPDVRTFVEDTPDTPDTPGRRLASIEFYTGRLPGSTSAEDQAEEVDFDLAVLIRGRGKLARLKLHAEHRYRDGSTVLVVARTLDGLAEFRLELDQDPSRPFRFHMSVNDLEGANPEEAWPIVEFLALSKAPNEFSLGLPGKEPVWNPIPHAEAPIDRSLASLVLQLRTVARHTGAPVRVPADFSRELSRSLATAGQLIAGGVVSGRWRSAEVLVALGQTPELVAGDLYRMEIHVPLKFKAGEVEVTVDRWARLHQVQFDAPRATPEGLVVHLEPAGDDRVDYRRGPWLTAEEQSDAASAMGGGLTEGNWVAFLGDAILGSDSTLNGLIQALATSRLRPDRIVRATHSDLPGVS